MTGALLLNPLQINRVDSRTQRQIDWPGYAPINLEPITVKRSARSRLVTPKRSANSAKNETNFAKTTVLGAVQDANIDVSAPRRARSGLLRDLANEVMYVNAEYRRGSFGEVRSQTPTANRRPLPPTLIDSSNCRSPLVGRDWNPPTSSLRPNKPPKHPGYRGIGPYAANFRDRIPCRIQQEEIGGSRERQITNLTRRSSQTRFTSMFPCQSRKPQRRSPEKAQSASPTNIARMTGAPGARGRIGNSGRGAHRSLSLYSSQSSDWTYEVAFPRCASRTFRNHRRKFISHAN